MNNYDNISQQDDFDVRQQEYFKKAKDTSNLCTASIIVGIISFLSFCFLITGLLGGFVGFILGIIGLHNAYKYALPKTTCYVGVISSFLGLILALVIILKVWFFAKELNDNPFLQNDFDEYFDPYVENPYIDSTGIFDDENNPLEDSLLLSPEEIQNLNKSTSDTTGILQPAPAE